MSLPLLLTIAALVSGHPLFAESNPFCVRALGFLAGETPDEDPRELVTETYRRLMDELGATRFTPETLVKMVAGGDPFLVPEQAGADFFALQKRLREFHELIRAKGWDGEPVRQALLIELGRRRVETETVTETIERATANSFVDYPLNFPDGSSTTMSPDGRWVVGIEGKHSLVTEYYVHDRTTRRTRQVTMPQMPVGPPTFSPDGAELLFPNHTAQMFRVPFDGNVGEADFSRAVEIGKALGVSHSLREIHFTKTPGQFFAGRHVNLFEGTPGGDADPKVQRFNLSTNERTTVNLREYFTNRVRISAWGVIPGSDDIWVMVHLPQNAMTGSTADQWRIHVLSVAADGSVKQSQMPRSWPGGPIRGIHWQPGGKTCLVHDNQGISVWPENRRPEMIYPKLVVPGDEGFVQASAVDPVSLRIAFLFRPRSGPARLDWVNLDTRQVEPGFELNEPPQFHQLKFLADGKGLLMLDTNGFWQVINHHARP